MKLGLLSAMILGMLALTNAVAMPGKYSDVAAMLRQYQLSSNRNFALKEDMEGYDDEDADEGAIVQEVQNALLSSIIQGDGDDRMLLAAMMEGDEDDAVAQFRFIRRAIGRFRNSPLGRRVTDHLRSRFCGSGSN